MKNVDETMYLVRVSLDNVTPEIWRTLVVPGSLSMFRFHQVLQAAMGWYDSHLHFFRIDGTEYGNVKAFDDRPEMVSELETTLGQIGLTLGSEIKYMYDLGDGWEHTIEVIAVTRAVLSDPVFKLLEGANACPPEDVGGPDGYENFCTIMDDQEHIEHEFFFDWIGGYFDRTEFDLGEAQELVASLA